MRHIFIKQGLILDFIGFEDFKVGMLFDVPILKPKTVG